MVAKAKIHWLARFMLSLLLFFLTLSWALAGTVTYTYDEAGRLTKADYGRGKSITYTYDEAGNLLEQKTQTRRRRASSAEERETGSEVRVIALKVYYLHRVTLFCEAGTRNNLGFYGREGGN